MADTLTPQQRSERMSRVRSKDTKPEWRIRSLLHRAGYRYRLHAKGLPGKPDLVFASRKKVVFVHGCFWHRHHCKLGNRMPKSRIEFWRLKLDANKKRDSRNRKQLEREGWSIMVVWECQLQKLSDEELLSRLRAFLDG